MPQYVAICGISSGFALFAKTERVFRERNTIFFLNYNLIIYNGLPGFFICSFMEHFIGLQVASYSQFLLIRATELYLNCSPNVTGCGDLFKGLSSFSRRNTATAHENDTVANLTTE